MIRDLTAAGFSLVVVIFLPLYTNILNYLIIIAVLNGKFQILKGTIVLQECNKVFSLTSKIPRSPSDVSC